MMTQSISLSCKKKRHIDSIFYRYHNEHVQTTKNDEEKNEAEQSDYENTKKKIENIRNVKKFEMKNKKLKKMVSIKKKEKILYREARKSKLIDFISKLYSINNQSIHSLRNILFYQ